MLCGPALSMLRGDDFAKQFGGATGDDPDWFLLSVTGYVGDTAAGSVDFYLADYRFGDNGQDYVVDTWEWVDLTGLGEVDGLGFALSSSDTGEFGMNTPGYFALDHLVVSEIPEPGALVVLAACGLVGIASRRRR